MNALVVRSNFSDYRKYLKQDRRTELKRKLKAIEELGIESKKSNFFKSSLEFNLAFLLNTPPEGEEEKRASCILPDVDRRQRRQLKCGDVLRLRP